MKILAKPISVRSSLRTCSHSLPLSLSGQTNWLNHLFFPFTVFRFRFWNLFFCRLLCLFRIFRVALLFSCQSSVLLLFISNSDIISHLHKFVNNFFIFFDFIFCLPTDFKSDCWLQHSLKVFMHHMVIIVEAHDMFHISCCIKAFNKRFSCLFHLCMCYYFVCRCFQRRIL